MSIKRISIVITLLLTICLSALAQNTTQIYYLSGTDKDNLVDWEFYCSEGRRSGQWTTIGVPSCWEQQGFGGYNYGHDMPFEERSNEYGLYKYQFEAPLAWQNREVKIVFEGVMTDAEVKVNGTLAGEIHQGAFYEFKYSITDLLKYGEENTLEVKVDKASANESINFAERKADFWIFGGIYRPVYLEVLPKERIERMAIDAQADGTLIADLFVNANRASLVKATLYDVSGNREQELPIEIVKKKDEKWRVQTKAENAKTWNPEYPNLYKLVIELIDADGKVFHQVEETIGFRTVEVREADGIYVNGQRIKFKGVNMHSFHPESGRTTSKKWSIQNALMMKDMNMNAVRMSHYPPDVHFLDTCDSLGLFVIDEVCTWNTPALDTQVGEKIVKETVVRDVNHPSIVLWANGNESGWNPELDDDYLIWDIQQREVIHPWNVFGKTNTLHYPWYQALANDAYSKDRIFFPTELLHGLYDGGHGAALEDYWQLMWDMPTSAGGFLWDFADEGIVRTDKGGIIDTDGDHAADGIVGPYGEKEGSYFTIKEIWSSIYIEDRYVREGFDGKFNVENRYHFTQLDECQMMAKWVKFRSPESKAQYEVLNESSVKLPSLLPQQKGSFTVDLPENWASADVLHLIATDPHDQEIFTWSYPVKAPKILNAEWINIVEKGGLKVTSSDGKIHVQGKDFEYVFDQQNARLLSVNKNKNDVPISNGPVILNQKDEIDSVWVINEKKKVEVIAIYEKSNIRPGWVGSPIPASDTIRWTVYPDGLLDLRVAFKTKKTVTEVSGITFSYPEEAVLGMRWLGDGPYRVWRNRTRGTRFQVWESDYNNTVTGQSGFVYPEFKGFYSDLYWVRVLDKNKGGFTVHCHTPHTYLRMLTPENPKGKKKEHVSVDFPEGDLSFVKNIPAIGTKFQDPKTTGPHGQPENFFGNTDEPLVIELTFEFD